MIWIESKGGKMLVNEKEATSVYYDRETNTCYVNYANVLPRRIPDVLGITYTNDAYPTCYQWEKGKDL